MLDINRLGEHLLGKSDEFKYMTTKRMSYLARDIAETSSFVDVLKNNATELNDDTLIVSFTLSKSKLDDLVAMQHSITELMFKEHMLQAQEENDALRCKLCNTLESANLENLMAIASVGL